MSESQSEPVDFANAAMLCEHDDVMPCEPEALPEADTCEHADVTDNVTPFEPEAFEPSEAVAGVMPCEQAALVNIIPSSVNMSNSHEVSTQAEDVEKDDLSQGPSPSSANWVSDKVLLPSLFQWINK